MAASPRDVGYRMLLGHVPDGREGVLTFVKIGLVLALATSWAAYRVVIYDVALRGPAEIVDAIGGASGIPGATGGMIPRLGEVDRAMVELSRLGMTGGVPFTPQPEESAAPGNTQAPQSQPQPQYQLSYEPGTIFGSSSLGTARLVFLTATRAAYASVRLVAGLLLAIGPLFIVFLLFEGTRTLFEGWVRALVAAAVGALAVTMTGELCDCFESRRQGIGHIMSAVVACAGARPVRIWTTAPWASSMSSA